MALLILGPLLLGYPHLVASYRFVQRSASGVNLRWDSVKVFRFFLFLTATSLLIRFVVPQFIDVPKLPYGVWEILLSLSVLALLKIKIDSIYDWLVVFLTLSMVTGIIALASNDPLAFVGFALIFHNWVAFGHWFFAAKDTKNKLVVMAAIVIFAIIHYFVILGFFDTWISFPELSFLSSRSFEVKGWALAPWTNDAMMWNRVIVLYAFGLSMHYFVWLQAIPQCLDQKSVPTSFRNTLQELRKDCGPKTAATLLVLGLITALAMWFHTASAGRIYFGIAMLHGWLEMVFFAIGLSFVIVKRKAYLM